jgi:hypothetical protein
MSAIDAERPVVLVPTLGVVVVIIGKVVLVGKT